MGKDGLSNYELSRYERQVKLPEIGETGQLKLKSASVLIVGMGGLGSASALYLAAAGVGRLGIVDSDRVELSNLQRQVVHAESRLGEYKVDSACRRLLENNSGIVIDQYAEEFSSKNAARLVRQYDVVVDGSDNFHTRYLINDACIQAQIPFVYGAVAGFEGQVSVFDAQKGPCYRCLFPISPEETGKEKPKTGVLSALPGVVGSLQAVEVLKLILEAGEPLVGFLLVCSLLEGRFLRVAVNKRNNCASCGFELDE